MSEPRRVRCRWSELVAVGLLLVLKQGALCQGPILDLATVRPRIQEAFESLRFSDQPYGQYRMTPSGTAPSYYASLDAALARTIMGEELGVSVTQGDRAEWIGHLQSFALLDGSYSDQYGHSTLHANGMTIGGLGVLGGTQRYPATLLYAPFDEPSEVGAYLLSQINWTQQWGASHKFWGGPLMFSHSSGATPEWTDAVFDWLDANVDSGTGWWRVGQQPADSTQGLGGGAHIWPIYEHHGHAFPSPERVIDRILQMQSAGGNFAGQGIGYLNLDALYGLKFMRTQAPDYRAGDIDLAVQKHGQWLAGALGGFLDGHPSAHSLLALAGELGLMNQLAPSLYFDSTGAAWTDIFTDGRFYRTADVETFAPFPPPTGEDGPAAYAQAVLGARPVGYWRLGQTAPPTAAEAQGKENLTGLYNGLGVAAGPGNLAQSGPRPADGYQGMSADNRAVHLGTSPDYVCVPNEPALDITGALSLEAWVWAEPLPTSSGNVGIVAKYRGTDNQRAYLLYVEGNNDSGKLGMVISPDGTFTHAADMLTDTPLPTNRWLHLTATFEPGQFMRLYINGALVKDRAEDVPDAIFRSTADLWIGTQYDSASASTHFSGLIDEVAVYDRALGPVEVAEHYRAGRSPFGDANRDGEVDERDASILAAHWQQASGATWSQGDFNGDGRVDDLDASILAAHWQEGAGQTAPGVPEPSAAVLLVAAWILFSARHCWAVRGTLGRRQGRQSTTPRCTRTGGPPGAVGSRDSTRPVPRR